MDVQKLLDNTRQQMRKGLLELCILSIIAKEPAYPSDIITQLKESETQLIVKEGTIYPLLTRLKNAELLDYDWRESTAGPPRKYYKITSTGIAFLHGLNQTWNRLQQAVNEATTNIKFEQQPTENNE